MSASIAASIRQSSSTFCDGTQFRMRLGVSPPFSFTLMAMVTSVSASPDVSRNVSAKALALSQRFTRPRQNGLDSSRRSRSSNFTRCSQLLHQLNWILFSPRDRVSGESADDTVGLDAHCVLNDPRRPAWAAIEHAVAKIEFDSCRSAPAVGDIRIGGDELDSVALRLVVPARFDESNKVVGLLLVVTLVDASDLVSAATVVRPEPIDGNSPLGITSCFKIDDLSRHARPVRKRA